MKSISVSGGIALSGKIEVGGSKNAALPIIFACILTEGVSRIKRLPDIGDTRDALEIIKGLGARVWREADTTLIDTTELSYQPPSPVYTSRIRASAYLLGSCLARFGRCFIPTLGGCNFSNRPIDMHIDACLALGGRAEGDSIIAPRLLGKEIFFSIPSVGATVNAILLAATAEGDSVIHGCAIEPHIDSLIAFINSAGGDVLRRDRDIYVSGRGLHGGSIDIIGDMIEAGSWLCLSAMEEGRVTVKNAPIAQMRSVFSALSSLGIELLRNSDGLSCRIRDPKYASLTATPYPGFPTDLQPIFAPLMAICQGGSITDLVWRDRFGYLSSLASFGVESVVRDGAAEIIRSTPHNGVCTAPDLRGGMACLLLALFAKGESLINRADIILRGYENLEEKLSLIGANIKITDY